MISFFFSFYDLISILKIFKYNIILNYMHFYEFFKLNKKISNQINSKSNYTLYINLVIFKNNLKFKN